MNTVAALYNANFLGWVFSLIESIALYRTGYRDGF